MAAFQNDGLDLRMRRYAADGRVTAFVNGKELSPPDYAVTVENWQRDDIPNHYGEPTRMVTVTVKNNHLGEVVAVYQTRDAELRTSELWVMGA